MRPRLFSFVLAVAALASTTVLAGSAFAEPDVRIVSPGNGSTVRGPDVTISIAVTDVTLVPAAQAMRLEDLHVHYLLDVDPGVYLTGTTPVPQGDPIQVHSSAISNTFENVAPGAHRVTVLLTFSNHQAVQPPIAPAVSFTVAAAGIAPSQLPRTGVVDDWGGPLLAVAGVLGILAGTLLRWRLPGTRSSFKRSS